MPRISDAAIEKNRVSSRNRYHRNKAHNQKVQKAHREKAFREREFIGWDGEGWTDEDGQHHYMLFGASTGDCITGQSLGTTECLELMLQVEQENPSAYHVGFAFEYDVNMILKDLAWRHLAILKEHGKCRWADPRTNKRYRIEHVPHKWFRVSCNGVSATIFDVFGFFHTKYTVALDKYGIGSEEKRERIKAGKDKRADFQLSDISEIKSYWLAEIGLLPPLMDKIRDAIYDAGYFISEWHGPGALAAYLLRDVGASKWHSKKIPTEVKNAIRYAYAGGRFTGALCGLYLGDIYTADINSAYIYACSLLPRMDRGTWDRQNPNAINTRNLADFGLYRLEFDAGKERRNSARSRGNPEPPYPLFHRAKNGVLRWPRKCIGWYWTPEAQMAMDSGCARVLEAWVFNHDKSRPFRFVNDAYDRRVELQHQGNPAEKTYKWALAAMYGAFARRVGWNRKTRKAPPSHELAWAGYITSWCRAAVYRPAMAVWNRGKERGLISIDTDGVTATVPFQAEDLPNGVGEGLGQWKLEKWTGILQWQNGIYWLRDSEGNWRDPKSRGIPKGSIPFAAAMEALEKMDYSHRPYVHPKISLVRTRFIGYGQALRGQFKKWRRWVTEPFEVRLGGNAAGKSVHQFRECYACREWNRRKLPAPEVAESMHTISLMPEMPKGGKLPSIESHPHRLPWLEEIMPDLPAGFIPGEFKYIVKDGDM